MPTFRTERITFFHLPKTGGTWVWQAVPAAGVRCMITEPADSHAPRDQNHTSRLDVDGGDRLTVAFVRHPLDWWRSYWGYRMRVGWDADHTVDQLTASDDFSVFVSRVVEHFPGHLSDLVSTFVGLPTPAVDFVGRFERLIDDTCTALRLGGERFDEVALRGYPNVNVTDYNRFPALYRRDLAERLADAESRTIERFYADDPIPRELIAGDAQEPLGKRRRAPSPPTAPARIAPPPQPDERVRALERALERARHTEASLELALAETRDRQQQAERALSLLRTSRVIRYTRPLRVAYGRLRDNPRVRHRSARDAPSALDATP